MIFILLTLLSIIGLISDLKKKEGKIKKNYLKIFWSNFKFVIILSLLYWFVLIWVNTVYQISVLINLSEIINKNIFYQIEWYVLSTIPILSVFGLGFWLMFRKDVKESRDEQK